MGTGRGFPNSVIGLAGEGAGLGQVYAVEGELSVASLHTIFACCRLHPICHPFLPPRVGALHDHGATVQLDVAPRILIEALS